MTAWFERWQIPLYVGALALGALVGIAVPSGAHLFESAVTPTLIVLLYATFLAVPFRQIGHALRDIRFLAGLLVLNFLLVPIVVFALTRVIADRQALLVGVLLVLLTPCVDYVIVFSRLAGGASARLLAATPALMLLQILLLPVYLYLFVGADVVGAIDVGPFVQAFLLLIVLPLVLAVATQMLARRHRPVRAVENAMAATMVPVMMLVLLVVVASQTDAIRSHLPLLATVIPVYAAFLVVMPFVGLGTARLFRQDVAGARAIVFSGSTRNSLVVLPLALSLPDALSLAAVVVVMQTLVELIGMVVYVRAVPRLVPR